MKLRRIQDDQSCHIQANVDGRWVRLGKVDGLKELAKDSGVEGDLASDILAVCRLSDTGKAELSAMLKLAEPDVDTDGTACLPFSPASFRDFMLFESHAIDAARGYVKRFMPGMYPVTRGIERLTGKPFKRFKPHSLWYKQPIYYLSNHLNFGMSGDDVAWPAYTSALDYELEIGAVLARPLHDASPEEAEAAIGGFVVLNDFSARDVQIDEMACGFGPQKAKHFYSTMSAVMVTADEILPAVNALTGRVLINGKEMSRCDASSIYHSLGEAIAFASKGEQLHPGELFGTGTLPSGSGMETGNWLKKGDTITLQIDQIGELTNRVREGA